MQQTRGVATKESHFFMNITGLILLAALSVITFFGFGRRIIHRLEIKEWMFFAFVLLSTLGILLPDIPLSGSLSLSVGGFVIPLTFLIAVIYVSFSKKDFATIVLCIVLCASVAIALNMAIRPVAAGFYLLNAMLSGVVVGVVAFGVGKKRSYIVVGALAGILIGDVVNTLLAYFSRGQTAVFGGNGVFDAVILSLVVGVALRELVEAVGQKRSNKKVNLRNLSMESAEDILIKKVAEEPHEIFKHFE